MHIYQPALTQIENVMPALTQQLENCLSCMNVDYISDYSRVHGQNLALSPGHHGVMPDRDGMSSPTTNQRFGTVRLTGITRGWALYRIFTRP